MLLRLVPALWLLQLSFLVFTTQSRVSHRSCVPESSIYLLTNYLIYLFIIKSYSQYSKVQTSNIVSNITVAIIVVMHHHAVFCFDYRNHFK